MIEVETSVAICCVCGNDAGAVICNGQDYEYETCSNHFRYVLCGECGHVYLKDLPEPRFLDVIYPKHYMQYSVEEGGRLAWKAKRILDFLLVRSVREFLPENGAVLDVGCAQGRLLDALRWKGPALSRFDGVEISEEAAAVARLKGYSVHVGTFESFDGQPDCYDAIFLDQVIEHLYEPGAAIAKLGRLVKPGGHIVFKTPTTECMDFSLFKRRFWGGFHMPRHFNIFNEANFGRLLRANGLDVVRVNYLPQPGHWLMTFENWLKASRNGRWLARAFYKENVVGLAIFTLVELGLKLVAGRTSNMEIVARRPVTMA